MADLDEVTISSGGTEVAILKPNVDKFQKLRGGTLGFVDPQGKNTVASLSGVDDGGEIFLGQPVQVHISGRKSAVKMFWFSLIWKTHPFELAGKGKGPR